MKKILLSLLILVFLGCANSTASEEPKKDKEQNKEPVKELTSTVIKGSITNSSSRSIPDITHVAAIPVTNDYSPSYIVENLIPISIDESGEYKIEGIETDVIIVLLNIVNEKTSVVDFISLEQGDEGLMLLPIEGIDPTEIDLGEIDYSDSASAISDLLPVSFSDLENAQLLELATLDDVYRNIENHINNSSEVVIDGETKQQVIYIKPELSVNSSITDLYSDLATDDVIKNSEYNFELLQYAHLPIDHTVDEIEENFSITTPNGLTTYTCPELKTEPGITDEGHLFTKRYTSNTEASNTKASNMMFEYCWDNKTDAENGSDNHVGNVSFFSPNIENWIPEQGVWKYNWGEETYGEFDVNFAQVYDEQGRFQGYFPKPELVYDENNKLTQINIEWYHQENGEITLVTDLTIAETLMTHFDVELASYTYDSSNEETPWVETSNHLENPELTKAVIENDVYLIDKSKINSMDDISVEDSEDLKDGKTYVERIYIMYHLGNELGFAFTWGCNIEERHIKD